VTYYTSLVTINFSDDFPKRVVTINIRVCNVIVNKVYLVRLFNNVLILLLGRVAQSV
jgi:hypothetical protein